MCLILGVVGTQQQRRSPVLSFIAEPPPPGPGNWPILGVVYGGGDSLAGGSSVIRGCSSSLAPPPLSAEEAVMVLDPEEALFVRLLAYAAHRRVDDLDRGDIKIGIQTLHKSHHISHSSHDILSFHSYNAPFLIDFVEAGGFFPYQEGKVSLQKDENDAEHDASAAYFFAQRLHIAI